MTSDLGPLRRSDFLVDPSEVPEWVYINFIAQCVQVGVVTLLLYDTLCTLHKEVRYFWSNPRNHVSLVFFANRYLGIIGASVFITWNTFHVSDLSCQFAEWMINLTNWANIVLIDYILLLRVAALYQKSRNITFLLYTMLVSETLAKIALLIRIIIIDEPVSVLLATDATSCAAFNYAPPAYGVSSWSIPLAYSCILMGLALYKATDYWRSAEGVQGLSLVNVVVKDQFLYFMLVVACSAINIANYYIQVNNPVWQEILQALGMPSFLCILGSHLLFNLKDAGERGVNVGTSYKLRTISAIDFA